MVLEGTVFASLIRILLIGMVGLLAYKYFYLDREVGTVDRNIPSNRGKPLVITSVGLCTPKKVRTLGTNKYQVDYDHPDGYSPVYYRSELRDDLVPIDDHQHIFGTTRPVYIEHDLMMKLAYGHEDDHTRKFMKSKLVEISKSIASKQPDATQMNKFLAEIDLITEKLTQEPKKLLAYKKEYVKAQNEGTKIESDLRRERTGVEGRIERRLDPIVAIAGKKASTKSDD